MFLNKRTREREHDSLDKNMLLFIVILNQYGIGIRTDQWKIIQNLKIDLGKEENLTYGQGGILNHWQVMVLQHMVLAYGYSSGSK